MGQGEEISSASRNFESVEFTRPNGKSLAWSCWLPTKGVQMRSSACASNWNNCVPNNALHSDEPRVARPAGERALGLTESQ